MDVTIAGVRIDCLSFDDVVSRLIQHAQSRTAPAFVITPNVQHLTLFRDDPRMREAYGAALMCVPDGVPLLWAARLLGKPLQGRVNGTDLMEALCHTAADRGLSVFFLGGREGAAAAAAQVLQQRHPGLRVSGIECPPLGFEHDDRESGRLEMSIGNASPDILFVGLGSPKQEIWMHHNIDRIGVPVAIGIGGSFELVAGMVPRAPVWMRRIGAEWLFRLGVEPKRLWKRYLVEPWPLLGILAREWTSSRTGRWSNSGNQKHDSSTGS